MGLFSEISYRVGAYSRRSLIKEGGLIESLQYLECLWFYLSFLTSINGVMLIKFLTCILKVEFLQIIVKIMLIVVGTLWNHMVYIVRESQGQKCPFHLGQGMSGKIRETCNGQGKNSIFVL